MCCLQWPRSSAPVTNQSTLLRCGVGRYMSIEWVIGTFSVHCLPTTARSDSWVGMSSFNKVQEEFYRIAYWEILVWPINMVYIPCSNSWHTSQSTALCKLLPHQFWQRPPQRATFRRMHWSLKSSRNTVQEHSRNLETSKTLHSTQWCKNITKYWCVAVHFQSCCWWLMLEYVYLTPHDDYSGTFQGGYSARFPAQQSRIIKGAGEALCHLNTA